jgi:hypothetical protein
MKMITATNLKSLSASAVVLETGLIVALLVIVRKVA